MDGVQAPTGFSQVSGGVLQSALGAQDGRTNLDNPRTLSMCVNVYETRL